MTPELDEQEVEKRLHAVLQNSPRSQQRRARLAPLEELVADETQNKIDAFTPIAHRTRRTTAASSPSASPRPHRAAKSQATARIVQTSLDDSSSESAESADAATMDVDGNEEDASMREATPRRVVKGKRAPSTATPSDADDESGDDSEDEASDGDSGEQAVSHLRGTRQLRNGKVVPLPEDEPVEESEAEKTTETMQVEQAADEDDDEDAMDDNGEQISVALPNSLVIPNLLILSGDDVDLMNATSKTLLRYRRDDLLRLCEERGVEIDGTKKELVQALLEWVSTLDD